MKLSTGGIFALGLTVFGIVQPVAAQVRDFTFSGNVTSVFDPHGYFGSAVKFGDPVHANFRSNSKGPQYDSSYEPYFYYGSQQHFGDTTFVAGKMKPLTETNWLINAFDQKQPQAEDGDILLFESEPWSLSLDGPYMIFWDAGVFGSPQTFNSDAFKKDWFSALTPSNQPEMNIVFTVWEKVYADDGSWSAGIDTLYAKIVADVSVYPQADVAPTAVPEPSTYALSACGLLAGVIAVRRRKRKN